MPDEQVDGLGSQIEACLSRGGAESGCSRSQSGEERKQREISAKVFH